MNQEPSNNITIRDINIPFSRLIVIILKIMLASIPAVIVFYAIFFAIFMLFAALFGGGVAILSSFLH